MKTNWKKIFCVTLSLIMLLGVFVACSPNEEPPEPAETTPAPTTPSTPSTPSKDDGTPSKLEAKGTDMYFSMVDGDPCITYITYNGYHNPIEESIFCVEDADYVYHVSYEYNKSGKLTSVDAQSYSYYNYGEKDTRYSATFSDNGKSTVIFEGDADNMTTTVEYHNNGTIKSWVIGLGDSIVEVGFEQDQNGRRTSYTEFLKKMEYTYEDTSRIPTSTTYLDDETPVAIEHTYTDGKLVEAEIIGVEQDYFEIEFTHTADAKRPAEVVWREYESTTASDYEQCVYEMTYNEKGLYATLACLYYENEVIYDKDYYTYEYNESGLMTKETSDIYYDSFDQRGGFSVSTLEYDAEDRLIKEESKFFTNEEELLWYENTTYQYDTNGDMLETDWRTYDSEGAMDYRSHSVWTYERYESGLFREVTVTNVSYGDGVTISGKTKSVSEYDENGLMMRDTVYYYENPDNWDEVTDTEVYNYQPVPA